MFLCMTRSNLKEYRDKGGEGSMYEKVSKACSGDGIKHKMAARKRAAVDFSPALASFEINASRILCFFPQLYSQIRLLSRLSIL